MREVLAVGGEGTAHPIRPMIGERDDPSLRREQVKAGGSSVAPDEETLSVRRGRGRTSGEHAFLDLHVLLAGCGLPDPDSPLLEVVIKKRPSPAYSDWEKCSFDKATSSFEFSPRRLQIRMPSSRRVQFAPAVATCAPSGAKSQALIQAHGLLEREGCSRFPHPGCRSLHHVPAGNPVTVGKWWRH